MNDCDRYREMGGGSLEGLTTVHDQLFAKSHAALCEFCKEYDLSISEARTLLRESSHNHQGSEHFTNDVVRAVGRDRFRRQLEVWRPTLIGAVAAAVFFGTVVQAITAKPVDGPLSGGSANFDSSEPTRTSIFEIRDEPREDQPRPTEG